MGAIPDIVEATDIVVGDMIQWLECPPKRWAAGEVLRIKINPEEAKDTIWIRCELATANLPQVKVGQVARRKMDRLRIDKVSRCKWEDEAKRNVVLSKQVSRRAKAVSAALRFYHAKGRTKNG